MPKKSKHYIDMGWGIRLRTWLVLPIIFILLFLDRTAAGNRIGSLQKPNLDLPYNPDLYLDNEMDSSKTLLETNDTNAKSKNELVILPLAIPRSDALTEQQKATLKNRELKRHKNKEKTKKMIGALQKACRAPINEKLYFCENLDTLIENGNKILNDQIQTYGNSTGRILDSNYPDVKLTNNSLPYAVYTNPDSEEYCMQSFRLSLLGITAINNPDLSTNLRSILKLRIDADSHLCHEALANNYNTHLSSFEMEKASKEYLLSIRNLAKPQNTLHPIHIVHSTILELAKKITTENTSLELVKAASEIIDVLIHKNGNINNTIINRLIYAPKELILVGCEKTRMIYAEILLKENIPALQALQITARTSVFQIEKYMRDIYHHKYPEALVNVDNDESFDMLSMNRIKQMSELALQEQFTMSFALYVTANRISSAQYHLHPNVRSYLQRCIPTIQKYLNDSPVFTQPNLEKCLENIPKVYIDRFFDADLFNKTSLMLRQPPQPKMEIPLALSCFLSFVFWYTLYGLIYNLTEARSPHKKNHFSLFKPTSNSAQLESIDIEETTSLIPGKKGA